MKTKILVLGALFASLCASVQGQTPLLHLSFDNVSGSTVSNDGSGGSTFDGSLVGTATVVAGGVGNCLSCNTSSQPLAASDVGHALISGT